MLGPNLLTEPTTTSIPDGRSIIGSERLQPAYEKPKPGSEWPQSSYERPLPATEGPKSPFASMPMAHFQPCCIPDIYGIYEKNDDDDDETNRDLSHGL